MILSRAQVRVQLFDQDPSKKGGAGTLRGTFRKRAKDLKRSR